MRVQVRTGVVIEVEGKPVKIEGFEAYDFRLVHLRDGYRVVEYTTGATVTGYSLPSAKEAISLADKVLTHVGKHRLGVCVAVATKLNPKENT